MDKTLRRFLIFALIGFNVSLGLWIIAATPVPNTFISGDLIDAAQVNANFADLVSQIAAVEANTPPGTILVFGGANPPPGFLLADGSEVNRATYPELFAAIGTAWGAGDFSTTFNLPDLRGRFIRGVNGTASDDGGATLRDPDATTRGDGSAQGGTGLGGQAQGNSVGSVQGDVFGSHDHQTTRNAANGDLGDGNTNFSGAGSALFGNAAPYHRTSFEGGNETRPKNAYVNYIIKY